MSIESEIVAAEGRPRLVTPTFLKVTVATFAYFMSVGALIPTVPLFVEGPLGGSEDDVGLSIGIFSLAAVIFRPLVGRLGDRRGRRVVMVAGGLTVGVSVLAYALVDSLLPLLVLRFVSGAGEALFYVGAASAINDLAPDERRGEALSYFSLALYAGLALGPVLGEAVLGDTRFVAAWTLAGLASVAAAFVGASVPETRPDGVSVGPSRRLLHRAALLPGMVLAAGIIGLSGFMTFTPLYARELGMSGSAPVFATYSILVLLVRSFGARIPDLLGPARSARFALTGAGVGLSLIALWPDPLGLFAGATLFALGQALAFPALMTIAVHGAPLSERGAVVGTFTAFFDLAFGLGAVALGPVAQHLGFQAVFGLAAAVAWAGAVGLTVRARRRARETLPVET